MSETLYDQAAERAVLSAICNFGSDAYFDIADMVSEHTFVLDSNAIIFKCLRELILADSKTKLDIPSIFSIAHKLGFDQFFTKTEEVKYLHAIFNFQIDKDNVRKFAKIIKTLEITRLLYAKLGHAQEQLLEISGQEPISKILNIAESAIFDFVSSLDSQEGPIQLGDNLAEYIQYLSDNQCQNIGISTGYKEYDEGIGGGLRVGTVNIIGARPKVGKTQLSDNIALYITQRGIPVLNLDTEMTKEDHIHRCMANLSEIAINTIEKGAFNNSEFARNKVDEAQKILGSLPYYHTSISGKTPEEQLAIIRRWLIKVVGLNNDGSAKPCVIIYDYLKLMSPDDMENMQEYQALGFLMTSLHNFALQYKLPILAFMQLNRDGINKETTGTASGSDRIIWLCSNFTIFKTKSPEEIAEDGVKNGNRKMVTIVSRHGPGTEDGDYISMNMKGHIAQIKEIRLKSKLKDNQPSDQFEVEDGDDYSELDFGDN